MTKKPTQTFFLFLCTLLLLVTATVSAQAQALDFTGTWNTVTNKGKKLVIKLEQARGTVRGTYQPNGLSMASNKSSDDSIFGFIKVSASTAEPLLQNMSSIRGRLKDNVLSFYWQEDGGAGAGKFTLSADGQSFSGTLSGGGDPNDTSGGTWNGTRIHSFAGAWQGNFGEGGVIQLILQQSVDHVTGQVKVNSADMGIITEGTVVGNTFRFKLVRVHTPSPIYRGPSQEYVGSGELVMDNDGKSFKGTVLNAATSATLLGR